MRKPAARIFLLASAIGFGVFGATAFAAPPTPAPRPAGTAAPRGDVEPGDASKPPAKAVDNSPAPTPGTPSELAQQAKKLYVAEKWSEAAVALQKVSSG